MLQDDTNVGKKWHKKPTSMATNEKVNPVSSKLEIKGPY